MKTDYCACAALARQRHKVINKVRFMVGIPLHSDPDKICEIYSAAYGFTH